MRYYQIGNEARCKELALTLSNEKPCYSRDLPRLVWPQLKFTRDLRLNVHSDSGGHMKFNSVIRGLKTTHLKEKHVSLQSLSIIGTLDDRCYPKLYELLIDPVGGHELLSGLRLLDLPSRLPPMDGFPIGSFPENAPDEASGSSCDCKAILQFNSCGQEVKAMPRDIGVVGRYNVKTGLAVGTPHRMFQSLLQALGVKDRHLGALWLHSNDRLHDTALRTYDNPFLGYGLHDLNRPLLLTKLVLTQFNLKEISTRMFTSFKHSSLRELRLKQCYDLPRLFAHIIGRVKLQVLEVDSLSIRELLHSDSSSNMQRFLERFSTLKTFLLYGCEDWDYRAIVEPLGSHTHLEICIISLGTQGLPHDFLGILHANHPNLTTLGNRAYRTQTALKVGKMPQGGREWLQKQANELAQFKNLERWQIITDRPIGSVKSSSVDNLGDTVLRCWWQAGGQNLKIVSIEIRNAIILERERRMGVVPEIVDFAVIAPRAKPLQLSSTSVV